MMIEVNRKKVKKMLMRFGCLALVIGLAMGYRARNPGSGFTKDDSDSAKSAASSSFGEVTDWGLSFQQEGQPPVGNATAEELAKYNAWYVGDTGQKGGEGLEAGEDAGKTLYLTFDAGYENGYTAEILDVLKTCKVPAAFFLVGTYMEENPDLVKRMSAEGHIVANHTMHHPDMSAIADEASFEKELTEVESLYKKITGTEMQKFYRPPQGKFSASNLEMAQKLGYQTIFWSLAYVDWYEDQQPTREEALQKLLSRTHDGAIILLHSTSKTNAKVLEELIGKWKDAGYRFAPLDKLVE